MSLKKVAILYLCFWAFVIILISIRNYIILNNDWFCSMENIKTHECQTYERIKQ